MARKEKWVTICPKCGSTDISPESNPVYIMFGLSTSYKQCETCGHHGLIFPKVPKSKVPKKPKSSSKVKNPLMVQTTWGEGYFKYLVYIGLPLTILIDLVTLHLVQSGALQSNITPLMILITLVIWLLGLYFLFRRQK